MLHRSHSPRKDMHMKGYGTLQGNYTHLGQKTVSSTTWTSHCSNFGLVGEHLFYAAVPWDCEVDDSVSNARRHFRDHGLLPLPRAQSGIQYPGTEPSKSKCMTFTALEVQHSFATLHHPARFLHLYR